MVHFLCKNQRTIFEDKLLIETEAPSCVEKYCHKGQGLLKSQSQHFDSYLWSKFPVDSGFVSDKAVSTQLAFSHFVMLKWFIMLLKCFQFERLCKVLHYLWIGLWNTVKGGTLLTTSYGLLLVDQTILPDNVHWHAKLPTPSSPAPLYLFLHLLCQSQHRYLKSSFHAFLYYLELILVVKTAHWWWCASSLGAKCLLNWANTFFQNSMQVCKLHLGFVKP